MAGYEMRIASIYEEVRSIAESRGISMIPDILHLFIEFLDEKKIGLDETKLALHYADTNTIGYISDIDYTDKYGFHFIWTPVDITAPKALIPIKANMIELLYLS